LITLEVVPNPENGRLEILNATKALARLIEQSSDPEEIPGYIGKLIKLEGKLAASGGSR